MTATSSVVTEIPAAASAEALAHFEARLRFETDCADVQQALAAGAEDFVLLDVRGPKSFAAGHVPAHATCRTARSPPSALPASRASRPSSSTAPARTATAPTRPPSASPASAIR